MIHKGILVAVLLTIAASSSHACSCGMSFHAKNQWEQAKRWAENGDTIFEGKVTAVKLHMKALEAKEGEWIPASFGYSQALIDANRPHTSATLEVTRVYRGKLEKSVEVNSFLGGGDCGFLFQVGESYLVFTEPRESGYWTWICSPSADVRLNTPLLRFLRGEKPTQRDLDLFWGYTKKKRSIKTSPAPRFPTGKICGRVEGVLPEDLENTGIKIQAAYGSLPFGPEWESSIAEDGRFCSSELRAGKYMLFVQGRNDGISDETLTYYPGVTHRNEARVIDLEDGKTVNIQFKAMWLRTQSVNIYFPIDRPEDLTTLDRRVLLISVDGLHDFYRYDEIFGEDRWAKWLHIARVRFEHVLPGHYAVFVNAGDKWLMQKKTIEVADRSQSVWVSLKRK